MSSSTQLLALRKRVYQILEPARSDDRLSRIVDAMLIGLITANVITIVLESMESLMEAYDTFFIAFEMFSVIIFTIEYLVRLWTCVEREQPGHPSNLASRLRYAVTPLALCDLIAILPSYLWLFVGMDFRFLRTLRLLRMFKFTRYSLAMNTLFNVFRNEAKSFIAAIFILLIVMILASSGMYYVEYEAQPEAFGSIPAAMWWAVAALTTVGYGDVTPITPLGKIFGACITIVGIGMIALPSGILASGFSEQLRRARKEYAQHVDDVLDEGVITESERRELETLRVELGFTEHEAAEILREAANRGRFPIPSYCPHCHKPLTGGTPD
jgi:voltage-gated potassium channel